jgi:hypothetical protein
MTRAFVVFLSVCCLHSCASRFGADGISDVSLGRFELYDPPIEMKLSRMELKEGPIRVRHAALVFGPDSLMKRVSHTGPDPFAPTFSLEFVMLKPDSITVYLHSPESTSVRLFRGRLDEGSYSLQILRADLPPGVHVFECIVGGTSKSRKQVWFRQSPFASRWRFSPTGYGRRVMNTRLERLLQGCQMDLCPRHRRSAGRGIEGVKKRRTRRVRPDASRESEISLYTVAISGSLARTVTTSLPLSFLPRILTSDWKCLLAPSNIPRKKSFSFLSDEYLISK